MTAGDRPLLAGRVALVTGAGAGIGAAIAARFAAAGAAIALADIDGEAARAGAVALRARGARAHAITADLTEAGAADAMVEAAASALGPIDVLVNNAGVAVGGTVLDLEPEAWRKSWALNVDAGIAASRRALPAMIERRRGSILFISSTAALRNTPGAIAYNATKATLLSLVRTMAGDHGPDGVRVNAIVPGGVLTTALARSAERRGQDVAAMSAHVPLEGRFALPEEIAAAALFLASDEASYITGHALVVDGGLTVTERPTRP